MEMIKSFAAGQKAASINAPKLSEITNTKLGDLKLFQKTLSDVIKGIRSHKDDSKKFISQVIREVKDELKSADMDTKVVAVQKLTYVSLLDGLWERNCSTELLHLPHILFVLLIFVPNPASYPWI